MENDYARLTPLTACDCCKSVRIRIVTNREAYGPKALDPDVRIYYCLRCKASVATHPGTDLPMGRMADAHTRALRSRAHMVFDSLWQYGRLSRTQAYRMLSTELEIPAEECHMAVMTNDQLRMVIEFSKQYQSAEAEIKRRREDKKHERRIKRAEREAGLEAQKRREKRAAFSYGRRQRYGGNN